VPREQTASNRQYFSMLHIDVPGDDPQAIEQIAAVLARHPGSDEVQLHIVSGDRVVTMEVGERFRVTAGPAVKAELDACFGREVARLEPPAAVDDDAGMPGDEPEAGVVHEADELVAEHWAPPVAGLGAGRGEPIDDGSASRPRLVLQAPTTAGGLVPGQEGRPLRREPNPPGGHSPELRSSPA